jgi:hypothetical protein
MHPRDKGRFRSQGENPERETTVESQPSRNGKARRPHILNNMSGSATFSMINLFDGRVGGFSISSFRPLLFRSDIGV